MISPPPKPSPAPSRSANRGAATFPQPNTPSPDAYRTQHSPLLRFSRVLAVGSVLALVLLCLAWELVLAPLRPGGSWLALKALPLCLPLAGLLKNRMYTYRWVSLVVWLYFTEGVVRAWGDAAPSRYYAMAEVALCMLLFTACVLHVRSRFAQRRTVAPPSV